MDTALLYFATFTAAGFAIATLQFAIGMRKIQFLRDHPTRSDAEWPSVSIIIPARNEARNLQQALTSVLSLNYPNLEIIAINDRSTDQTGQILDHMAQAHPNLKIIHITTLPSGWLGKNHALHKGAREASGEFLLFTDADVVMQPDTIRKAITYLQTNGFDHLTLSPETKHKGILLPAFSTYFFLYLFIYHKPWLVCNPNSKRYMGIGAFNLVRSKVYKAIDGHESIRLNPVDDLMLGKVIKQSGYNQAFLFGTGLIFVEWYPSLKEMVNGLMKNMFAGMKFSPSFVIASVLGTLIFILWPYLALIITSGPTFYLNLTSVILMLLHYQDTACFANQRRWLMFLYPIPALLLAFVQLRSMLTTYKQDGIIWRDTHYPLAELKKHMK